jgi:hypothetical protein
MLESAAICWPSIDQLVALTDYVGGVQMPGVGDVDG